MKQAFTKLTLSLLALLLINLKVQSQATTTYNTPGTFTYTVPAGVASLTFQCWGGGGGSYASSSNQFFSGGGGGFGQSTNIAVSPGQVYTIVVGTGGPGSINGSTNVVGTSSSVSFNSTILVSGDAGTLLQPGTYSGSSVAVGYNGGGGGGAIYSGTQNSYFCGGGGSSASNTANGNNGASGNSNGDLTANGGQPNGTGGAGGKGGWWFGGQQIAGTNGAQPGGGGGAPGGSGGNGRIVIFACQAVGSIGSNHTVPFPYELAVDSVYSIDAGGPLAGPFIWEQSANNSTWTTAPGNIITRSYPLPASSPPSTMYYRRKANSCAAVPYTNSVLIKTFTSANGQLNGTINGNVLSTNGIGVPGITITVQKTVALLGSPVTKTYTYVTGGAGDFDVENIFYGDVNNGDPSPVTFKVTPSKAGHQFDPAFLTTTLSNTNPVKTLTFHDTTVYAVSGYITQTCPSCVAGFTSDSVQKVRVTAVKGPLTYFSNSGDAGIGKYGITITDPGTYRVTPSYFNHSFSPVDSLVALGSSDVNNVNFKDNSTHTISGVFKAGCSELIGTAVLEFTDTVTNIPGPKFKKQVTTSSVDGSYSITLPSRSYKVKVLSFTANAAGADIPTNDLLVFFNNTTKDSLVRNIDTINRTLDLIYHRPPVLQIVNLDDTTCTPIPGYGSYTVFRQNKVRSFIVNIFEGAISHGCKIASDSTNKISILTNVSGDIQNDTLRFYQTNGVANINMIGGQPNIASPYVKFFEMNYTDKYGRAATHIQRNVVVLGIKADPGSFTTVSPQVPFLILHDPPGDNSYSYWDNTQSTTTALRFYSQQNTTANAWTEVKIGVDLILGFGVSVENSFWGKLNANLGVSATVNDSKEAIVSTSTNQYYSTSGNSTITGDGGDVYVGGAMNLLYSIAHEIKYVSNCTLGKEEKLMVADSGFATTYTYSEVFIKSNVIPALQLLADSSAAGPARNRYLNQISVWNQVLQNNANNKARAAFVENRTFDGTTGVIHGSTTTTASQTNTIEFGLEINTTIAAELGLSIAGNGFSGGVTVGFKMETGNSTSTTITNETTTGWYIDDDDDFDFFTVDIKKDPVYNTAVFSLIAGAASCPAEPVAQKRDNPQLTVPDPSHHNIAADHEELFYLNLTNLSESHETRTYNLTFDQGSNPGAAITIGGSPVGAIPIPYTIAYGATTVVQVSVKRVSNSPIYTYEGLKFIMSDACSSTAAGAITSVNYINAYFVSPCSDITMESPVNNFLVNSSGNNLIPISFDGYNLANLTSVSLQHDSAGTNSWITDTTFFQGVMDPTSMSFNRSVANITRDGTYEFRLKLVCPTGTIYTGRVTGFFDRKAPTVLGIPEPTDDNYVAGDVISFSYNENLNTNSLTNSQAVMTRLSNNAVVPTQVSGYQNKIVIVPSTSITSFTGDSIRVVLSGVTDVNGNSKLIPDTTYFIVGTTVPGTGPKAVSLTSTRSVMLENVNDSLNVRFSLPSPATVNTLITFSVGGSANYNQDYTVRYSNGQPLTSTFNGTGGSMMIPKDSVRASLSFKPIGDHDLEPDETIIISLLPGGDYLLGAVTSKTDTIKNDDHSAPILIRNGPLNLCAGQTLTLSVKDSIDGQPVNVYQWSNGSGNQSINVTTAGTYYVTVYTQDGFSGVSASVQVTTSSLTAPSLGPDVTTYANCVGETVNLLPLFTTTGLTTNWSIPTPTAAPAGLYRLIAANSGGCTDTAFATVSLEVARWTGAVNNDWNTAGNWNIGKVPSTYTHVIIPGGTPACIVTIPNAVAASVQVRSGATLHINGNNPIMVNGKCLTLPAN